MEPEKMSRARVGFLCSMMAFALFCQAGARDVDTRILTGLSDFSFVGSGPAKFNEDGTVDTTHIAAHGETEEPRPRRLQPGIQYIFHRRGPVDDKALALKELPDKLSRAGVQGIKNPRSSGELLYLFYGTVVPDSVRRWQWCRSDIQFRSYGSRRRLERARLHLGTDSVVLHRKRPASAQATP